jgi:Helix-turn-helix domain
MRSYAHLSEDERDQVGVLRAAGRSMGAIARALGRKTPMDAYVDGCHAAWISIGHPTRISRRSSSRLVNASGSRRHSKP